MQSRFQAVSSVSTYQIVDAIAIAGDTSPLKGTELEVEQAATTIEFLEIQKNIYSDVIVK